MIFTMAMEDPIYFFARMGFNTNHSILYDPPSCSLTAMCRLHCYLVVRSVKEMLGRLCKPINSHEKCRMRYSTGQAKPTYFGAVSIPMLDMTGMPLEVHKCWKTLIYNILKRSAWVDHLKTQYLPF